MGQVKRDRPSVGVRVRFGDVFVGELARSLARGVVLATGLVAMEPVRHILN
jgi:hypothetical protein